MACSQNLTGYSAYYSVLVGEQGIVISLSMCLSVREHIPGTAGPIFMKFVAQIPCGRGLVFLWRCCNICCVLPVLWMTSRLAIMGCLPMHCDTGMKSDVCECLVVNVYSETDVCCLQIFYDLVRQINRKNPDALGRSKKTKKSPCSIL